MIQLCMLSQWHSEFQFPRNPLHIDSLMRNIFRRTPACCQSICVEARYAARTESVPSDVLSTPFMCTCVPRCTLSYMLLQTVYD